MSCSLGIVFIWAVIFIEVRTQSTDSSEYLPWNDDVISTSQCRDIVGSVAGLVGQLKKEITELRLEIGGPPIHGNCSLYLASSGYSDTDGNYSTYRSYMRTNIDTTGQTIGEWLASRRGFHIALLEPHTCTLYGFQSFDTFNITTDSQSMAAYMQSLDSKTILVGVTYDAANRKLSPAYPMLQAVGLPDVGMDSGDGEPYPGYRTKLIFVAQKGYPQKTQVFRKMSKSTQLAVTVKLEGYNSASVLFKKVVSLN